jgi:hypothetical protein
VKLGLYKYSNNLYVLTVPDNVDERRQRLQLNELLQEWDLEGVPVVAQEMMATLEIAGDCSYGEYTAFGGLNSIYWLNRLGYEKLMEGLACDTASTSKTAS